MVAFITSSALRDTTGSSADVKTIARASLVLRSLNEDGVDAPAFNSSDGPDRVLLETRQELPMTFEAGSSTAGTPPCSASESSLS